MWNGGAKGFISTAGKRTGVVKSGRRRWETIRSFGLYFRSTQLDENLSLPESKPRYGFRYTRRRSPESAGNFKRKDLQQCTHIPDSEKKLQSSRNWKLLHTSASDGDGYEVIIWISHSTAAGDYLPTTERKAFMYSCVGWTCTD